MTPTPTLTSPSSDVTVRFRRARTKGLDTLEEQVAEHLKRSDKLFIDETTAPVLDPGRDKTKTGYLWALARDDRPWGGEDPLGVVYFYARGRAGVNAETFLTSVDGILQIDGCQGYNRLPEPDIATFMDEAMAGDNDHLLQTAMRWFNCT